MRRPRAAASAAAPSFNDCAYQHSLSRSRRSAIAGCARCAAAWRESHSDAVGYGDPRGVPELREALADYLGRVRGAAADPEHVVVCTGFRQGLSLTCRWLRANGIERGALEDAAGTPSA